MILKSPRFKANEYLMKVASDSKVLKRGNIGNSVHLIQQALIDLGYSLPSGSDGIFGPETEKAVLAFQKRNHLVKQEGIVGIETMSKLDGLSPDYEYRIRLNFFSIHLTNKPFDVLLKCIKAVYAQYGIRMDMASGKSLFLSEAQMKKFFTLDTSCNWTYNRGEEAYELLSLAGSYSSFEIAVFYIRKFKEADEGCGGHIPGKPACIVAAEANKWTPAHEIGHVLLTEHFSPVHSGNLKNIMHATNTNYPLTPILSNKQLVQIRKHPCCVKL
jgi:peptidoglycan hydrolase-like protein with peptidoglycan-binding domain